MAMVTINYAVTASCERPRSLYHNCSKHRTDYFILQRIKILNNVTNERTFVRHSDPHVSIAAHSARPEHDITDSRDQSMIPHTVQQKSKKTVDYYTTSAPPDTNGRFHSSTAGLHRTQLRQIRQSTTAYCTLGEGNRRQFLEFTRIQEFKKSPIAKTKIL